MVPQPQSARDLANIKIVEKSKKRPPTKYTEEDLKVAMELVLNERWSKNQAAKVKGIPINTLNRYLEKVKDGYTVDNVPFQRGVKTVFPADLEQSIVDYIHYRTRIGRGLTSLGVREAAYRIAVANNIEHLPPGWKKNNMAGMDWLIRLRERYPWIKLRLVGDPMTGTGQALTFDEYTASVFFNELESIFEKYPSIVKRVRIYNLDETALMAAQRPANDEERDKSRRSNEVINQQYPHSSGLVTACCIIRADGTFLPPAMVFPAKKRECPSKLVMFAPINTLGLVHHRGRMTTDLFSNVMQHFVKHSNSSMEDPTLLIYDQNKSHLADEAVDFARKNGVILLKLPSHCPDNHQPLVSLFGPLQESYSSAINDYFSKNDENSIFIEDVGGLFNKAFVEVMTPSNITSAFEETGICDFNRDDFKDEDFSESCTIKEEPEVYIVDTTTLPSVPEVMTHDTPTLPSVPEVMTHFIEMPEEEDVIDVGLDEPEMILGYP